MSDHEERFNFVRYARTFKVAGGVSDDVVKRVNLFRQRCEDTHYHINSRAFNMHSPHKTWRDSLGYWLSFVWLFQRMSKCDYFGNVGR